MHSLYRIQVMATTSIGVMKMEDIAPREGFKPIPLACQSKATVITITQHRLPDAITLPTPICLCGPLPERSVQTATLAVRAD